MLTDAEYHEAAKTLLRWFASQDLSQTDATHVMAKTLACTLTYHSSTAEGLSVSVDLFRGLLEAEISEYRSQP